jgi:hypothetical protein
VTKSAFFYEAKTSKKLGQWTLPRPQTAEENCTIHNDNAVPIRDRYILVSGNYQAGTWVTDFTDPSNPFVRGFAQSGPACADAARRVLVVVLVQPDDLRVQHHRGAQHLPVEGTRDPAALAAADHLNPQTQEFSLPALSAGT